MIKVRLFAVAVISLGVLSGCGRQDLPATNDSAAPPAQADYDRRLDDEPLQ